MHSLLARALEMGVHADGLTDGSGGHLSVEQREGLLRCEVRGPDDARGGTAWRWGPAERRPQGLPDDVPFLPRLTAVAVRDRSGLTVTWPAPPLPAGAPEAGSGMAGLAGGMVGLAGAPGLGRGMGVMAEDRVAEAWSRYAAEAARGDRTRELRRGMDELVRAAVDEGWEVDGEERVEGAVEARIVRLRREGVERSLTLSRALGIGSLVLLQPS